MPTRSKDPKTGSKTGFAGKGAYFHAAALAAGFRNHGEHQKARLNGAAKEAGFACHGTRLKAIKAANKAKWQRDEEAARKFSAEGGYVYLLCHLGINVQPGLLSDMLNCCYVCFRSLRIF